MKKIADFALVAYIAIIALAGFSFILWITPHGAGVSPDSTVYIGGAKSLLAGEGYSIYGVPVTHFPPLYPIFLAGATLVVADPIQAARFLNALLFGANAGLVACAVHRASSGSFWNATCAALFYLSTAALLELHAWAWSEPLFITFSLLCIILLAADAGKPRLRLYITSALFAGSAILTRYAGIALLPAALILEYFAARGQPLVQRLRRAIVWIGLASAPIALFSLRNSLLTRSTIDRSYAFHPTPPFQFVAQVLATCFEMIAPIGLPAVERLLILGVLIALCTAPLLVLWKRSRRGISWPLRDLLVPISCLLFCTSYILLLLASNFFFDASITGLEPRLLAPFFVVLLVGGFSLAWTVARISETPPIWWSFVVFATLSMAIRMPATIRSAAVIRYEGLGYTSRQWLDSETVQFVRSLPKDPVMYSNDPDGLNFVALRHSEWMPARVSWMTLEVNPGYAESSAAMCRAVRSGQAFLVLFDFNDWQWYLPTKAQLEASCHLPILRQLADGIVFGKQQR